MSVAGGFYWERENGEYGHALHCNGFFSTPSAPRNVKPCKIDLPVHNDFEVYDDDPCLTRVLPDETLAYGYIDGLIEAGTYHLPGPFRTLRRQLMGVKFEWFTQFYHKQTISPIYIKTFDGAEEFKPWLRWALSLQSQQSR